VASAQDFLGGANVISAMRDVRRVIHEAYRELGEAFGWSWLHRHGRVQLKATYSTGTVGYNNTSRVLTLATGSWPSWAADATVRIGDATHRVQTRTNNTSLVLDSTMNPGQAVASGTSYQVYPTCYTLEHDFLNMIQPQPESEWWGVEEVSYDEMMALDRYRSTAGAMRAFCVREVEDLHGSYGLYLHPAADAAKTVDYIYQRRGRQLRYTGHDVAETVGTISVTAAGVVTGSSTTFDSKMAGSVLRIGTDGTNTPTGLDGLYPYSDERIIATYTSATALTLDGTTTARNNVKYVVTDPVDINLSLANAMLACIRKRLAVQRNLKNKVEYVALYEEELRRGRQNDQRTRQPQVMGGGRRIRRRLTAPIGTDLT
jgi:hypothetical protein